MRQELTKIVQNEYMRSADVDKQEGNEPIDNDSLNSFKTAQDFVNSLNLLPDKNANKQSKIQKTSKLSAENLQKLKK